MPHAIIMNVNVNKLVNFKYVFLIAPRIGPHDSED